MSTPSGAGATRERRVVAGRYALVEPLGSGGMGTVWRAEDVVLGRAVAVKEVAFPHGLSDDDREVLRERTRREARAAARLDHPSAVTVYDVVEENGCPFLVMELVEARTLADVVRNDGPLPPQQVAEIGLAVLGALEAAHARGIVHRDVKPGNVMLRPGPPGAGAGGGRVVLTDFGIATSSGDASLTSTGLILGSPSYIAPERARGHAPGPASDLWSLGATMFTAVEGRPPYDAGDPMATVTAVVTGEHAPFVAAGPLQPVLAGLLQRETADRLDAPAARRLLEEVVGGAPPTAVAQRPVPAADQHGADRTAALPVGPLTGPDGRKARPSRPARARRRRSAPLVIGLAVVLVAAALTGGVALLTGGDGTRQHDSTASPATDDGELARPEGVPADWVPYEHPTQGWALFHPPSFEVSDRGDLKQFRNDQTRYTLRIDYTADPRPSALQAWQEASPAFARALTNYQQLRLEPVEFRGLDAADLEFTYSDSGADLRVLDRTFIVERDGDREAFTLYWQVPADRFQQSLSQFEQLAAAFVPNA